MSNCCDTPIDLGCLTSCDDIVTNITATCAGTYRIRYDFNGATISTNIYQPTSGFVTIPSGIFNEAYNGTFKVYDAAGVFISCFTFKMTPTTSVDSMPTDSDVLSSELTLVQAVCQQGLPDTVLVIVYLLTVNDNTLLTDGMQFNLEYTTSDESVMNLSTTTAGASIAAGVLTITDASQIPAEGVQIVAQILSDVACEQSVGVEYTLWLSCLSDLPDGVIAGTQAYLNFKYLEDVI